MESKIYLTVDKNPKGKGLLAIMSYGQPQFGDKNIEVLTVTEVSNMKAAKKWFHKMSIVRPWETRN